MDTNSENAQMITPPSELQEGAQLLTKSGSSWRNLLDRIKSMTPSLLARSFLGLGGLTALVWLISSTWPAILPFVFGAVVAYIVLPIVNWLDKFLPRVIGVIATLLGTAGLIGWFLSMIFPALGAQITLVYTTLPPYEEIESFVTDLADYVDTLPEPAQVLVNDFLLELNVRLQETIRVYATELAHIGLANVINLFNTIGFVLGFLVVPGWLLTVLKDREDGLRMANQIMPKFMRKDFWAVVRIVDRPFRSFLHGQLLTGLLTAVLVYFILSFLEYLDLYTFNYKLVAALLAGFFALIPEVGIVFAVITFFVLGSLHSLERAVLIVAVYVAANQIVRMTIAPRIEKSYLNIHPAILVMAIVILSEFGFLWVLIAAPITAVVRDLFQYVYGRFDDPPRPAGLLPSQPIPVLTASPRRKRSNRRQPTNSVPIAYRHGRAGKRTR